ncbi:AMP-binding protein [Actinomadura keratinilytica]
MSWPGGTRRWCASGRPAAPERCASRCGPAITSGCSGCSARRGSGGRRRLLHPVHLRLDRCAEGVVVSHRSVVNLIDWVNRTYEVGPGDEILFVTSFCFDLSVYDIFGVLAGAAIRLASAEELADPHALVDLLEQGSVTIWDSAPATLGMVMPFVQGREQPGGTRCVWCC